MNRPSHLSRIWGFFLGVFLAVLILSVGLLPPALGKRSSKGQHSKPHVSRSARHAKSRTDTDHDGLSNRTELRRTRTNPRKADTDGDGLKDGTEVRRTRTNPRKADTDGDGVDDGDEIAAGSDPRNPASVPGLPPANPPEQPAPSPPGPPPPSTPAQAVWAAPPDAQATVAVTLDGTASTGDPPITCTWSFENQAGSTVWQTREGCRIEFTFESSGTKYVKLIVQGGNGDTDSNKQSFNVAPDSATAPPNTTISSGPSGTTTTTDASFRFSASEAGSSFECKLDEGSWAGCTSPKAYGSLAAGSHTFAVRATNAAGSTDPTPATRTWMVETTSPPSEPPPEPEPEPEPMPTAGCEPGATNATTATQVQSAVQAGNDVCVTAGVGNVHLEGLGDRSGVVISTESGGSMGEITLKETAGVTIRGARFRSIELRGADNTKLLGNVIGGTKANRVYDQLIFAPDQATTSKFAATTSAGRSLTTRGTPATGVGATER